MPLQPHRWTPPPAPPRARLTHSTPPLPVPRLLPIPGRGPEDVVIDGEGRILTGIEGGPVLAVDPSDGQVVQIAFTGGRPLGLHAGADGSVLICDAERGLLRLDPIYKGLEVLVDKVDGEPLRFTSNVVEGPDGSIYFTESSRRYPLSRYMGDIYEHSGTGRLFRRHPDGAVETLVDGLQFANGLVLAPDGSCVVVAETAGYRLSRYRLTGPEAGRHDVLVDNLPGFPDNLGLGSDGSIWAALVSPRNPLLDSLLPRPGWVRQLLWTIPARLQPAPARTVWVQAFDFDGNLVHDLQCEGDNFAQVTGVAEQDGTLYLGSLSEAAIAVTRLPE
ncbi:SMP-30/gluconolactonase/LRE family protein [Nocardia aurantia]|uniref:SMP-30/gluconolactonase/LRE family protein n=1 Tax=Nocardia aurantia TaxID=2585199 RepID=UPI0012952D49|nr:SMP-30/gluconolactonase/LRE family protein [Nocardia aurantia]